MGLNPWSLAPKPRLPPIDHQVIDIYNVALILYKHIFFVKPGESEPPSEERNHASLNKNHAPLA